MIRKFDEKDLHAVMELWLESNIEAHDFIDSRYWKENYSKVEEMLPQAEIYVYEEAKKIRSQGSSSRASVQQEIIYSLIMLKKPGNTPFSGLFLCLKSPDSDGEI